MARDFRRLHAPEIELTSSTTARGKWALEDVVRLASGVNLRGCHYHETYEKLDGQWHIASSTLTRLREDIFNVVVSTLARSAWPSTPCTTSGRAGRACRMAR